MKALISALALLSFVAASAIPVLPAQAQSQTGAQNAPATSAPATKKAATKKTAKKKTTKKKVATKKKKAAPPKTPS